MDMQTLAKSIFELANIERFNCLLILFDMMSRHKIKTGKYPHSSMPMFNEIESTTLYLMKVAEDNKLNMDNILNWTADNGTTLLWLTSMYSESLASKLMEMNVTVTTVDSLFQIPTFRVS